MRRRKSSIPMGAFNPSYHYEMLIDQRRVKPFEEAIRSAISSSDVVLDIGTGSGILAILAARAGAKKVYAIERMADMRQIAESNFAREQLPAYIVPLKRSIHVSDGERLKASIEYNYGLGWTQLVISLNTEK